MFNEASLGMNKITARLIKESDWTGPGGKLAVWEADYFDHTMRLQHPAEASHGSTVSW